MKVRSCTLTTNPTWPAWPGDPVLFVVSASSLMLSQYTSYFGRQAGDRHHRIYGGRHPTRAALLDGIPWPLSAWHPTLNVRSLMVRTVLLPVVVVWWRSSRRCLPSFSPQFLHSLLWLQSLTSPMARESANKTRNVLNVGTTTTLGFEAKSLRVCHQKERLHTAHFSSDVSQKERSRTAHFPAPHCKERTSGPHPSGGGCTAGERLPKQRPLLSRHLSSQRLLRSCL